MTKLFRLVGFLTIMLPAFPLNLPKSVYQDLIVKGQCIQRGLRSCEPTYNIIKRVLDSYQQPFSMLDVGAAQGYFSFRTAHEYPQSLCVMLEASFCYTGHVQLLEQLCRLNMLPNTIFFPMLVTPTKLKQLGKTEHFDVVLALNFIHHCGQNWRKITEALIALGNTIIIENPPCNETPGKIDPLRTGIERYLLSHGATVVGSVPRHTSKTQPSKIFVLHTKKRPVVHGLQKITFKRFGGLYPDLGNQYLL